MAGPGGGPPRKSHTKSRKGCDTCKRRHIRCDESFPQCRNCTKHNCRCPYMDLPAQDERAPTPERPDLLWTQEIEAEIERWQQTGSFPFPDLYIYPAPAPHFFPTEDLRLIHHVASISSELANSDTANFTIWTRQIPIALKIGTEYGFVMHALLAFSATHIAWLTDCPLVSNMAYEHRGTALKGLHEAIGNFSRVNSDAILAASLLLSWQATEWRGWTQLMQGTLSVIDAMQPWKHESPFADFIAEQSTFQTAPPSPAPGSSSWSGPDPCDLEALQFAYAQLQRVEEHLRAQGEDLSAIKQLMDFVRSVRKVAPTHTVAQRFEMLNPLRAWLFWLPVMLMQQTRGSPSALLTLAHYYTVALVVEPLFPEVGAAYFGSLSLGPIEEIARRVFTFNIAQAGPADEGPLHLMEYPIDMVASFRARMGWMQPERTASFPSFPGPADGLAGGSAGIVAAASPGHYMSPVVPYGNPAFAYSQEHFAPLPPDVLSAPASAASPLTLDPFVGTYLGIPSPSGFGGYASPASSTFGEGSLVYSEHGGDDFALYEGPHSGAPFGGTSSPAVLARAPEDGSPLARSPFPGPDAPSLPPPGQQLQQQQQQQQHYASNFSARFPADSGISPPRISPPNRFSPSTRPSPDVQSKGKDRAV